MLSLKKDIGFVLQPEEVSTNQWLNILIYMYSYCNVFRETGTPYSYYQVHSRLTVGLSRVTGLGWNFAYWFIYSGTCLERPPHLGIKMWFLKTGALWRVSFILKCRNFCQEYLVFQDGWSLFAVVSQDRLHCIRWAFNEKAGFFPQSKHLRFSQTTIGWIRCYFSLSTNIDHSK